MKRKTISQKNQNTKKFRLQDLNEILVNNRVIIWSQPSKAKNELELVGTYFELSELQRPGKHNCKLHKPQTVSPKISDKQGKRLTLAKMLPIKQRAGEKGARFNKR